MKRSTFAVLFGTAVIVLAAGPAAADTWRFANAASPGDRADTAAKRLVEIVNQRLGGRHTIQYFGAASLGGEREMTEGVKLGTIDFAMTSTSAMTTFVPQLAFYDMPFLFRDTAHARRVATGAVGNKLMAAMEAAGIKGLATAESGFRNMLTNKTAINKPENMNGLKIRVIESPSHIAAIRAMGASPVPIAFPEVYGSLQQGVVDGLDLPIGNITPYKLYEVVKFVSLTEHIYTPHVFIMNLDVFKKLSADDQKVILDAAKEASDLERKINDDLVVQWTNELKSKGMQIVPVSTQEKAVFAERMKPVWAQFEGRIGKGLIEEAVAAP
jgi:tripartite ATP-independent transporter DctP family solute receptor